MHTTQEFNDLVVREASNRIIRLSDVGRAELGPQDTRSYMKMNGIPMVGVVVIPQPGANHIDIADAVYQRMETMKKDLPDDVVTSYGFDNTRFIRASIDEVRQTVYEAFVLVIIIIFLFLRNWRVTLIPCIVIPVSLIGTFFLMYVAGILDQRAVDAGRGALGRAGGRRRHRDDREHLHPHRTRHDAQGGRHRRRQGDLLRRHLDVGHADRRVLPDRLHGGHDRPPVPRIQHGDLGRGGHLDLRRADDHPDARDQAARAAREEELVLQQNRAVLRLASTTFTAARWPRSCAAGGWPCRWSC